MPQIQKNEDLVDIHPWFLPEMVALI